MPDRQDSARALDRFSEPTRSWFRDVFGAATPAQERAWESISSGSNTLVIAPTGSGKTLAGFLWSIDQLIAEPGEGTRVLYISPLKSLTSDVDRNLRAPLVGVARAAQRLGLPEPLISVGVRTGDTDPARRRELSRRPPDILLTTPESLFLLLTSAARETLRSVRTVIVDEIHAMVGTKRGAHLALSFERLDAMLERPAQRIGLSATARPHNEVARFLSGGVPTALVAPPAHKRVEVSVSVPVADMAELDGNSIWPAVEERIVDLVESHRSTIVFANSRRLSERLTNRINELYAQRAEQRGETIEAPLARAHHGSVSKEQRALIEDDLKNGALRAVVGTSSLELGIDMGAVDLVIQVESPPSVASGLQRVGRAGHQVGELSRGVIIPKHRTDLLECAAAAEQMLAGATEALRVLANPLDVLAQQTVAAAAMEEIDVEEWFETVRRSAPFATLPRSAYEATLDLLSGKYPSTDFAELRPRLVWDRIGGKLVGRPGAQRLAVTSGGAIPDRGMFAVYLASGEDGGGRSRVGELDEEMVYECRPGDVITLGATSWRITDIGPDRVLVLPAFGEPAKLPFWHGEGPGRPAELGEALGKFTGELARLGQEEFDQRCVMTGLDQNATVNLRSLLDEQAQATGKLPTDTTLLVERFRDELGDWRVVLLSPYGMRVHAPLALAVGARMRELYAVEGQATAFDDGIVVRVPDVAEEPPGAELFLFEHDEVEPLVTEQIGGSALFASRFRECAARALLLPRRSPGKRAPLWLQRQRAAQLLEVARKHPDFPIVLETARECLQDVFDLPQLTRLMARVARREVRFLTVETSSPSPFSAALMFGYVGAFMYEGDVPLAERRAAVLSLDMNLLAELLGRVDLREALDPQVLEDTHRELQRLTPVRRAADAEGIADLLRVLGPLTADEIRERSENVDVPAATAALVEARRAAVMSFAGCSWLVAVEDTGRLRDTLGAAVPTGLPAAFTEPVADPLGEILGRYARTRGPFTTTEAAQRFGLAPRAVEGALRSLAAGGSLLRGDFVVADEPEQWCDKDVLRVLRRRSLAAARAQIEPVTAAAYARYLPAWQHVADPSHTGVDAVLAVVEQLAGVAVPASALEPLVLGQRVRDYRPEMLDELLASGEVLWSGAGALGGNDGWVALHLADAAPLTLAQPADIGLADTRHAVLDSLGGDGSRGGGFFFRQLAESGTEHETREALWELVWAGRATNDTFAPVRALLSGAGRRRSAAPAHRQRPTAAPARFRVGRGPARASDPTVSGRWSLLPPPEPSATLRAHAWADLLLARHGVVTKGAVAAEGLPGGFAAVYKVLTALEESGQCQRGYFVESLGGAQFSGPASVERLRSYQELSPARDRGQPSCVLAATDPANPFGAALPWPARTSSDEAAPSRRPGRRPGALVVLHEGELVWYLERGGRTMLVFADEDGPHQSVARALAELVRSGRLASIVVERLEGAFALDPGLPPAAASAARALAEAGFARTPRGLRLR